MRFEPMNRCFAFEIPDDVCAEFGIPGFAPSQPAYRSSPWPRFETLLLPINGVRLCPRSPLFDLERLLAVLVAIRAGDALPPVEVTTTPSNRFNHTLYHGYHRYLGSIAAGFTHVPAIVADSDAALREARESATNVS